MTDHAHMGQIGAPRSLLAKTLDFSKIAAETRAMLVIDTHTGGEPTRVAVAGVPDLGPGSVAEQLQVLRTHYDGIRTSVIHEPRGSDVMVGAVILPSSRPGITAGIIFFNNVGYLGMCGHGTIGVVVALNAAGLVPRGKLLFETPVGDVSVEYHGDAEVSVDNVPSYVYRENVSLDLGEYGNVTGDIAWGGNWFFLVNNYQEMLRIERARRLTDFASRVRSELDVRGVCGAEGGIIDHVELFTAPADPRNHSRNFVLCPGGAHDRSPCGTGTSAKIACLAAQGKLLPGEEWRQEGILGSVFKATYRMEDGNLIPTIRGQAYLTGVTRLLLDPNDPYCWGFRS